MDTDKGNKFPPLPLFLDLVGRHCLLVCGGDGNGLAKAEALLQSGARLTVVAEQLVEPMRALAEAGGFDWQPAPFRPEMLDGVWLVVSLSNDAAVNTLLLEATQARGIFLNVVDQPLFCTAFWPAVVERPPVRVAIATGGATPALAGYLRRRITREIPDGLEALALWLVQWRPVASELLPDLNDRGRFWRELLDGGVAEQYLAGDHQGAEEALTRALDEVRHAKR